MYSPDLEPRGDVYQYIVSNIVVVLWQRRLGNCFRRLLAPTGSLFDYLLSRYAFTDSTPELSCSITLCTLRPEESVVGATLPPQSFFYPSTTIRPFMSAYAEKVLVDLGLSDNSIAALSLRLAAAAFAGCLAVSFARKRSTKPKGLPLPPGPKPSIIPFVGNIPDMPSSQGKRIQIS